CAADRADLIPNQAIRITARPRKMLSPVVCNVALLEVISWLIAWFKAAKGFGCMAQCPVIERLLRRLGSEDLVGVLLRVNLKHSCGIDLAEQSVRGLLRRISRVGVG